MQVSEALVLQLIQAATYLSLSAGVGSSSATTECCRPLAMQFWLLKGRRYQAAKRNSTFEFPPSLWVQQKPPHDQVAKMSFSIAVWRLPWNQNLRSWRLQVAKN